MAIPVEKPGLIGRESDDRDARLAHVVLTEVGQRVVADATATFGRMAAEVFRDRWTREEIDTLADLLGRIGAGPLRSLA